MNHHMLTSSLVTTAFVVILGSAVSSYTNVAQQVPAPPADADASVGGTRQEQPSCRQHNPSPNPRCTAVGAGTCSTG